jgi:hypothetical protein
MSMARSACIFRFEFLQCWVGEVNKVGRTYSVNSSVLMFVTASHIIPN